MTQSFVGTREQVLSALMHAIRQFQRQRRNSRLWSLRTVRTCDCHSAWVRTPIRAFPPSYRAAQLSGYLRQRIQLRAIAAVTQEAFPLSARRRCNGRRQAERAGVTPRIARAILRPRRHSCAGSCPSLSHSPLCPCPLLNSVPMVHSARITALAWKG
jgi:hypothetical protein